jgi:chaperonin GroEL
VKRALVEPLRQIAENAGEEGAIVLGKVNDSKEANYGFNALTSEYEDLVKAGVLETRPRSCALPCRTPARSRR